MKKLYINGEPYIKLRTIREEIRFLRRNINMFYGRFSEAEQAMVHLAYNDIIKALYREELKKARTPEEIDAILEMPGDFIVCRRIGKKPDVKVQYFAEWDNGNAVVSDCPKDALYFDYESKAEEVMEMLNEAFGCGWSVLDMSPEENERTKRLMKAIFEDGEAEKEKS